MAEGSLGNDEKPEASKVDFSVQREPENNIIRNEIRQWLYHEYVKLSASKKRADKQYYSGIIVLFVVACG